MKKTGGEGMSAGERVFSVVRGRLYERLPTLALPLGKISCCEADVMPAGTELFGR